MTNQAKEKSFKIPVTIEVTGQNIENIVITALEGSIGYWCKFLNDTKEYDEIKQEQPDLCFSEIATAMLLNNIPLKLYDEEEKKEYDLTLQKLIDGIRLNHENRRWDNDLENMDATTADCIFQYALFGDVIYG